MSQRRIRRRVEQDFPYGKSMITSCGLVAAFMLVFARLDPKASEMLWSAPAWALAGLATAIVALFYAEFRLRNKHRPPLRHVRGRIRHPDAQEFTASEKC